MRPKGAQAAALPGQAIGILKAALREVEAGKLVAGAVRRRSDLLSVASRSLRLADFERIQLVAFGKAAPFMAASLAKILGRRLNGGLVVAPPAARFAADGIRFLNGAHPLPDRNSVRSAREILRLARAAGPKDLLFVLISGGGSAQVCLPAAPVTLAEKSAITGALLRAGAGITELNAVRKHLSAIKGGRLAQAAYPARVVNLVLSDVIGNDLESIASGPTYWDSSTYADAVGILKRYHLWKSAPASVKLVLRDGELGLRPETLRRNDPVFRRVATVIIGDNRMALGAAARRAKELGWRPVILSSGDSGEARREARRYVRFLGEAIRTQKFLDRGACFLAGGELTVRVRGSGRGGRNTEFALAALVEAARLRIGGARFLVASLGTDGRDGTGEAAGAFVTNATHDRAERLGLRPESYLEDNDSYSFFKKAGGLIVTGPTRTNVMDVRLLLAAP
jgi:glycerate 2-kinase